jgi:polysaccharide biosynthesis/export protein
MRQNFMHFILLVFCCAVICIAADAPLTYVLGPGDEISFWALGAEEISAHPVRVDPAGYIDAPLIGRLQAGGQTVDQLRTQVEQRLKVHLKQPQVAINVTEFRSQPVSVLGAVNKPGIYQLQGQKTLLEVLSLAEGVRNDSGSSISVMRRMDQGPLPLPHAQPDPTGQFTVAEVNLKQTVDGKGPAGQLMIQSHDVVTVSRAQTVYVIGEVKKAGGFQLGERERISVLQALSLAEGLSQLASKEGAKILRTTGEDSNRQELPVNLKKMMEGKAEDIALKPDDILFVPNSKAKNVALKTLEAAVNIGTGVTIYRVGFPRPY